METIPFIYDDGGRAEIFRGSASDCVCRAAAIASGWTYREVYQLIASLQAHYAERGRHKRGRTSPRNGVDKKVVAHLMRHLRFDWTPTMGIGTGCRVHLRADEIPMVGRIVVSLSGHVAAVVDGVLHDTEDCSRGGTRCVYGYWSK